MSRAAAAAPRRPAPVPLATELLIALAGGALQTLPYVHTDAWALQLGLVALLAFRCKLAGPGRAAAIGFAFGWGWLAAGTWWLYVSMHRYGGLPAGLAALAVALLAAFLSLYLAGAMALYASQARRGPWRDALCFAGCWLLAELSRGLLFTGFPWVASGYAQVDAPLAVLAPWVGVYGVGAAMAFLAALLTPRSGHRLGPPLAALVALGALAVLGPWHFTEPSAPRPLQVTLLQTNVPQDEKFSAERMPASLQWLSERLLAAPGQLVVAPETAVPLLPEQLDGSYWQPLVARFTAPGHAMLVGVPLGSYERGYTNSAVGLSPLPQPATSPARAEGLPPSTYRYDKHHLVPFGEFIPRGFRWFTEAMNIPLGDFDRGVLAAPSFAAEAERIAPNICYEDLFGEELAARFRDPASAPTLFANLSNIGWFGDTVAIPQHLQISRFRTLEFQRPMLRATNTGATAAIDHEGRVIAQLPPFTQGQLEVAVQGRTGLTPYARWAGAFGLAPLALAGVLLAFAGGRARGAA